MHCDVSAERYQYRRRGGGRKEGKGAGGVRRREGEEERVGVIALCSDCRVLSLRQMAITGWTGAAVMRCER